MRMGYVMLHWQNSGKYHNIKIGNKSGSVKKFKNLGTTWTNENCIHEEVKGWMKLGNGLLPLGPELCYLPVCYSKIERFKIYRIIILPVLYGCKTWSLTHREEHRLRMFEVFQNRMLRIFWPKKDKVIVYLGRGHHKKHSSPNIT